MLQNNPTYDISSLLPRKVGAVLNGFQASTAFNVLGERWDLQTGS